MSISTPWTKDTTVVQIAVEKMRMKRLRRALSDTYRNSRMGSARRIESDMTSAIEGQEIEKRSLVEDNDY